MHTYIAVSSNFIEKFDEKLITLIELQTHQITVLGS